MAKVPSLLRRALAALVSGALLVAAPGPDTHAAAAGAFESPKPEGTNAGAARGRIPLVVIAQTNLRFPLGGMNLQTASGQSLVSTTRNPEQPVTATTSESERVAASVAESAVTTPNLEPVTPIPANTPDSAKTDDDAPDVGPVRVVDTKHPPEDIPALQAPSHARVDRSIRVFAHPRSGHHAIMDWIRSHLGVVYTLNPAYYASGRRVLTGSSFGDGYLTLPDSVHPLFGGIESHIHNRGELVYRASNARPPSLVIPTQMPEVQKAEAHYENMKHGYRQEVNTLFFADDYEMPGFMTSGKIDAVILALIGGDPAHYNDIPWQAAHIGSQPNKVHNVFILRDPFNWAASRLAWKGRPGTSAKMEMTDQIVQSWITMAEMVLGKRAKPPNTVIILYNRWTTDSEYREEIAHQLGFSEAKSLPSQVPRDGGGSSFDGTRFQGRAHEMRTDIRFQQFIEDPQFRDVFRRFPQLKDLSEELFGFNPLDKPAL